MILSPRRMSPLSIGLLAVVALSSAAAAQEPKSAALAKELTGLMDAAKMDAIAAKDGADPESYVAALYFPGSQLLVVGAKYAPAVLLKEKLDKKEYREIYIDLNSAAVPASKMMFEDLGADGLQANHADNAAFDSVELGGKRTHFDDDWRKAQKISEDVHAKAYADAEVIYERLLQALIGQAKK
jgi:hypothetical protein